MTARLFSVPLESASVSSLFAPASSGSTGARSPRRSPSRLPAKPSLDSSNGRSRPVESADVPSLWGSLLESLQEGVMVISRDLKPIYCNQKAKELCKGLAENEFALHELPIIISEVCHRLMRSNGSTRHPLVMECRTKQGETVRISARWFYSDRAYTNGKAIAPDRDTHATQTSEQEKQPYILIFLENCTDSLREELRIEQKKYDLTDREAEIWMLLRQEYTYQEIAKMLQISLNTVKTHVKNVYAKRRSFQGQERFWCSE